MNFKKIFNFRRWPIVGLFVRRYEWNVRRSHVERIREFPTKQISVSDLSLLPQQNKINLNTCPIGTLFICKPSRLLEGVLIIGEVVLIKDILIDQMDVDSILSPDRGINRYIGEIITES